MIAVMAAMKEEVAGLKKQMTIENTVAGNGYRVFHGRCKGG